jgi:hypothetical protein
MRQGTCKILPKTGANLTGENAGFLQLAVEVVSIACQLEGFELGRTPRPILAHQYEVACVRHQHLSVAPPIAAHLIGAGCEPSIIADGLHLNHATLGRLPGTRLAPLYLPRRIKSEVGVAHTLVGQLTNAEHFWFQRTADSIE